MNETRALLGQFHGGSGVETPVVRPIERLGVEVRWGAPFDQQRHNVTIVPMSGRVVAHILLA